jgi:hypothetical protein
MGIFEIILIGFVLALCFTSVLMSREWGKATMNKAAPYSHHATKLLPFDWAMAAGIKPIRIATTRTSIGRIVSYVEV